MINSISYFDSFGVEHIPKKFTGNRNTIANIFRTHEAYDSIMCGYYCNGFINFMLHNKKLIDFTSLLLPNNFNKNDKKLLEYFQ